MTKKDIHENLVAPVCALEEYCVLANSSPIVDTVAMALRKILDDIEEDLMEENKNDEARNGSVQR